jgi:ketosteroid isomerase-like protein
MKRKLLLLLLASALFYAGRQSATAAGDNDNFSAFLKRWEQCVTGFVNGDPTLWKQNTSRGDDVTILGAFGGYEKGWKEVGPRFDWASSQFKNSGAKLDVEYLNSGVSGDLAFTVSIERANRQYTPGVTGQAPQALRTTHIFRKENGAWKLLHRHGDPLVENKRPNKTMAN